MSRRSALTLSLGAVPLGDDRCRFEVWAPAARTVEVHVQGDGERHDPLQPRPDGIHTGEIAAVSPGSRYTYRLDGDAEYADPASLSQPDGVHGPSAVIDAAAFRWTDAGWNGVDRADLVLYEFHVGTFTAGGTFADAVAELPRLRDLGVTAVEPLPIAQFPGGRNWGYDGVFPFAAQDTYGGPEGFAAFVDACHRADLAVVLDVVYNHLGPEGGIHRAFGPYFTDAYKTPWGEAVNFDGPGSDHVRRYFIENALSWFQRFHVDALRLDAVHGIYDRSAIPFLQELSAAVDEIAARLDRRLWLIAESALNDPRIVRDVAKGGMAVHAQWSDDLHHALHARLTGERDGYYVDYGTLDDIANALRDGFVFDGRYSRFRDRRFGAPCRDVPSDRFVVFAQNHDQVGNSHGSARLTTGLGIEDLKLLAGAVILSPYLPLLFMGEDYGETAPFPYFISHSEPELIDAVRRGRRRELASTIGDVDCPDPQAEATYLSAKVDPTVLGNGGPRGARARLLHQYHRRLLELRRTEPALGATRQGLSVHCDASAEAIIQWRRTSVGAALVVLSFAADDRDVAVPAEAGRLRLLLDSAAPAWGGSRSDTPLVVDGRDTLTRPPRSVVVYGAATGDSPAVHAPTRPESAA